MYVVYVLYSQSFDKIYIGYTSDLIDRFKSHNFMSTKGYTVKFRPWKVLDVEFFENKELDGVVIASPDDKHCEQIITSIKNSKSFFCEKPFCNNYDELIKIKKVLEIKKNTSFEKNDESKEGKAGLYQRVIGLKAKNPKLRLIIIGDKTMIPNKIKNKQLPQF